MFLLGITNDLKNNFDDLFDIVGVFDTYEKAQEKQKEINETLKGDFEAYVIKYDLNELYINYIKKYLKEE